MKDHRPTQHEVIVASQTARSPSDLRLWISDDKVTVYLDSPAPGEDLDALLAEIEAQLEDLELPNPPDRSELRTRIEGARDAGGDVRDLAIVQGVAPEPGEDGRLEWAADFFVTGYKVDEDTGRLDYWERLEQLSVGTGRELARVYPPKPGRPGVDVFGAEVPPPVPLEVALEMGPGVDAGGGDGCTVYAAAAEGRLRWANGVLAVDRVFTVPGDVGLETGNVSHPGAVIVNGDVRAGATIEADGDVVVKGTVEPCNIRAQGSLTVNGGIVGRADCRIELGGGVHARYIRDAVVGACEDVVAINEVVQSRVMTRGRVATPRGRIVGGEVTAHRGVDVSQLGAEGGAATTVVVGTDFKLAEHLAAPRGDLERAEQAHAAAKRRLDRIHRGEGSLDPQELEQLTRREAQLEAEVSAARQVVRTITRRSRHLAVKEVKVRKRSHPGAIVTMGQVSITIEETIDKSHIYRWEDGQIVVAPLAV